MANVDLLIRMLFEDKGTQKAIDAFEQIQAEGKNLLGEQRAAELFVNIPSADALASTNQGIRNIIGTFGEFRTGLIDTARAILTNEQELEKYRQKLVEIKRQLAIDEYNKLYQIQQLARYELSELVKQQSKFNAESAQYANIATQISQKQSFLNDVQKKVASTLYEVNNATVTQEEAAIQLSAAYNELSKQLTTIQNSFQGLLKVSLGTGDFEDRLSKIREQMSNWFSLPEGDFGQIGTQAFGLEQIEKTLTESKALLVEYEKTAQAAFGTQTEAGEKAVQQLVAGKKELIGFIKLLENITEQNRIQAKEKEAQRNKEIKAVEQELRVASQLEEAIARAGKSGASSQVEFKGSVDNTIDSLREEIVTLKNLLETETQFGGTGKDPSRILEEISGKQRQLNALTKTFKTGITESILATTEYVGGVNGLVNALDRQSKATGQAASQAFLLGDAMTGMQFIDKAREIDALSKSIAKFAKENERANGHLANLAPMLQSVLSPLNKLGFTMFLVTQNIKTAQIILESFFNTVLSGAQKADLFVSFSKQVSSAGLNVKSYYEELRQATEGLINMNSVQAAASKAIAAGNMELARAIPQLAQIAIGASYTSGELSKATENFDRLVLGILKGEPEIIDEVNVFIRAGNAVAKYAKETNQAREDISEYERQIVTLNAVLENGKPYEEVTKNMDSYSSTFLVATNRTKEFTDAISKFYSIFISVSLEGQIRELERYQSVLETFINTVAPDSFAQKLISFLPTIPQTLNEFLGKALTGIVGHIAIVSAAFDALIASVTQQIANLAPTFDAFFAFDFRHPITSLKAVGSEFNKFLDIDKPKEFIDTFTAEFEAGMEEAKQAIETVALSYGLIEDAGTQAADSFFLRLRKNIASGFFRDAIDELSYFTSAEYELQKDRTEAAQDYIDNTNEAIEEGLKEREEMILEHENDMLQLEIDYNKEREKERQDHIKELEDLDEDLADDLLNLDKDVNKDKQKENEDYAKEREDLEEDHQKRLRDILLKYEQQKLTALIDRNARALFEAEQERDSSIREENENYQDSLDNLEEKHKDELKQIEEQEEEKRQEYIDAYEKRKKDLEKDYEDRLKELEKQHLEEQKEIQDAHRKEIEALNKKIQEEQAKRYADFQDRLDDLQDNYDEQQFIIDVNEHIQTLKIADEAAKKATSVTEFYRIATEAATDYYDFITGIENDFLPPIGDLPDTPPTPGGIGDLPDTPGSPTYPCTGGKYCTVYGQVYNCPDGRIFVCTGGIWTDATGFIGGNGQPVNGRATMNLGVGGTALTNVPQNQQYRVTLQVRNDNMLQQIIDESVSSVLLEVIG
jgi:alpha-D-ribose 1-methylphosphonate 5-triphosphate synthase subunit PhnG